MRLGCSYLCHSVRLFAWNPLSGQLKPGLAFSILALGGCAVGGCAHSDDNPDQEALISKQIESRQQVQKYVKESRQAELKRKAKIVAEVLLQHSKAQAEAEVSQKPSEILEKRPSDPILSERK